MIFLYYMIRNLLMMLDSICFRNIINFMMVFEIMNSFYLYYNLSNVEISYFMSLSLNGHILEWRNVLIPTHIHKYVKDLLLLLLHIYVDQILNDLLVKDFKYNDSRLMMNIFIIQIGSLIIVMLLKFLCLVNCYVV